MAISCCFGLRGNLYYPDFIHIKFYNINYWYTYFVPFRIIIAETTGGEILTTAGIAMTEEIMKFGRLLFEGNY